MTLIADPPQSASSSSSSAIDLSQAPLSPEETARITQDFLRDGYRMLPCRLNADEIAALKSAIDRVLDDPDKYKKTLNIYGSFVGARLFETDPIFEDMLTREPIISLVESILGADCHLIAENAVRNQPGLAIDNFHADDLVMFPLPEGVERHDPRIQMPVHVLTVQILLTDVPSDEYGPTQFVPGSHYSGRYANDLKNPTFEGKGPVSIYGKAGEMYLHNGQCWHRGAPNTSDTTRYLLQLAYSRRWVSQRFYPFVNYQLPQRVLERADERRKRVLGFHQPGPYG